MLYYASDFKVPARAERKASGNALDCQSGGPGLISRFRPWKFLFVALIFPLNGIIK